MQEINYSNAAGVAKTMFSVELGDKLKGRKLTKAIPLPKEFSGLLLKCTAEMLSFASKREDVTDGNTFSIAAEGIDGIKYRIREDELPKDMKADVAALWKKLQDEPEKYSTDDLLLYCVNKTFQVTKTATTHTWVAKQADSKADVQAKIDKMIAAGMEEELITPLREKLATM